MAEISALIRETAVHSSLYTNPEIFTDEMHRIFGRGWVYVGHESEIPKQGDYLRRTMGLEPILVIRGKAGIRVVANRCAHRGNLLCQAERGNKKVLACPYHGWVFSPDGDLLDIPYPEGTGVDQSNLHLKRARIEIYRGFIFATFAEDGPSLALHLGKAAAALDRSADNSPVGEVELSATWVRHIFDTNWKMIAENDTDGYHVNFVHDSFAKGVKVQYKYESVISGEEEKLTGVARYLGGGHSELDYGSAYDRPLSWLGVEPDRYPDYTAAMLGAYGQKRAQEIMRLGPPHTFIFPNLFIAETCLTMIQPAAVGETIHWHTPLYYKGVPAKFNTRILRQGEVALGPASFLTADDAVIAERQWRALDGSPSWLDVSRGLKREIRHSDNTVTSHYTDETPIRGFWRYYTSIMSDAQLTVPAPQRNP